VEVRQILLVLEVAQVVAGAFRMADAQQHPLVADLEHIAAGDVLVLRDAQVSRVVGVQQVAQVGPVLEVGDFINCGFCPPL
jgi:hypothetical protein